MKRRFLIASTGFAALLLAVAMASSHEMTEKYIPVGAYPTLQSPYASIGTISGIDAAAGTITLNGNGASHTYKITEHTRIWLDRSLLKQPTLDGTLADIKTGMRAEIRGAGPEKAHEAMWVKVQVSA